MNNKYDTQKILISIASTIFGVFMIGFGLFGFHHARPNWVSYMEFGGDYYTAEHLATQRAANNVFEVAKSINSLGTIICVAIGMAFLLCGLFALFTVLSKNNIPTTNLVTQGFVQPKTQTVPNTMINTNINQ